MLRKCLGLLNNSLSFRYCLQWSIDSREKSARFCELGPFVQLIREKSNTTQLVPGLKMQSHHKTFCFKLVSEWASTLFKWLNSSTHLCAFLQLTMAKNKWCFQSQKWQETNIWNNMQEYFIYRPSIMRKFCYWVWVFIFISLSCDLDRFTTR